MENLRKYLNSLSQSERADYAARCGTTVGYLRKALSVKPEFSMKLAVALDRESGGQVPCETLLPEADWGYLQRKSADQIAPQGEEAA